ncbi:hypothetical protein [Propionivibrio sp.]|uniref:hypothetical protein n=1 Tax=Propionivibrio sp. TaxID=2212460 RepID=UPI0025D4C5BA|nr:hypothetical protein [Propionivibrio sp.]
MKVLITGGAGFLGRRLASKLLQRGVLRNAAGVEESIDRLVLFDAIRPTDSPIHAFAWSPAI